MVNKQGDDGGLQELALFAGAGGGILGGHLLGWQTVCAVEYNTYAASVLCARQNDGILSAFPIWDDVRTFDGRPWRGIVDVVSGGFPCQDISCAGKGAGLEGERSGLWSEMARIIGEVRPRYAFIENSPMLTIRGLETVLCDLAALGFDAEWGCISAGDCGAVHERDRIWVVAADTYQAQLKGGRVSSGIHKEYPNFSYTRRREDKPGVERTSNGIPAQMDRLAAIGNAQFPLVAATAFSILQRRLDHETK